jgi:serine/threonine-protein kinase
MVEWLRTGGSDGGSSVAAGATTTPGKPPTVTVTGPVEGHTDEARKLLGAFERQEESRTGQLIADKYKLGRRLGSGGMGVVYEATNTWTGRQVALKLMHPWFSAEPETVSRFRREAQSATRIKHPSIVDVLDMGEDRKDGALFIVQEFLTGDTLRQHLVEHGPLPVLEAAAVLEPIMDGLAAAHEAGVVHRDVKPENVILSVAHGGVTAPKLIDFGVSKITAGDHAGVLQTDRVLGTPAYMSPEQLRASDTIDGRTDVWAVGAMMYELLCGRRPFAAENRGQVWVQILTVDPKPLRELAPAVPKAVAQVVARALEREREARWPTMRAMLAALREALAAAGTVDTNAFGMTIPKIPTPLVDASAAATTASVRRKAYWWWIAAMVLIAAGIAALMINFGTKIPKIEELSAPIARPAPQTSPPAAVPPEASTPPPAASVAPSGASAAPPAERPRPTGKRHPAHAGPPPASPAPAAEQTPPEPKPKRHLILDP